MIINNILTTCANCGKGEESVGDLKACTACKLVKYCNRDCQVAHRSLHKKACKKRAAELHDIKLFKQPPPPEDCPICMLPLPTLLSGWKYKSCCGKRICSGCIIAVRIRDSIGLCPFCRTPTPSMTSEEAVQQVKKRVEIGDAEAMHNLGGIFSEGMYGMRQDMNKALELFHRAGELGHTDSYNGIGVAYDLGNGVERDEDKAKHYYELAAMGGDMEARHNLGVFELHGGNYDRALKHFILASIGGMKASLSGIQEMFKNGDATKEDYTQALRAYQAYLCDIKSPQRDEAVTLSEEYKYYEV